MGDWRAGPGGRRRGRLSRSCQATGTIEGLARSKQGGVSAFLSFARGAEGSSSDQLRY